MLPENNVLGELDAQRSNRESVRAIERRWGENFTLDHIHYGGASQSFHNAMATGERVGVCVIGGGGTLVKCHPFL